MAALGDLTMNVGINIEPFEWRVLKVLGGIDALQRVLNDESQSGWDIYELFPDFTIILRKQIQTPEESLDD